MTGGQPRRTTVSFDQHSWDMVERVARAKGLSPARFIAKAAEGAALQYELKHYEGDDELADWRAATEFGKE